jgi:hypothetical protein
MRLLEPEMNTLQAATARNHFADFALEFAEFAIGNSIAPSVSGRLEQTSTGPGHKTDANSTLQASSVT